MLQVSFYSFQELILEYSYFWLGFLFQMGSWGQFHDIIKGLQAKGDGTTVFFAVTFLAYGMRKVAYSLKLE